MLRLFLAALTAVVLLPGHARAADVKFINILTGGTSGVYYPLGVALTRIYEKVLPESKATVQATKASAENLNLLQAGKGELAITLGDTLSLAWKGDADAGFKAPLTKLRGIAALYPNYIHLVARADSGIKSITDLKGKRISVGAPKSGTEINSRTILKAAGMSYTDLSKVEYLPYAESVELIKNRQIDGTLLSSGLGVAAIRDLAASADIVIVSIPAEIIAKTGDPAYQPGTIPAETYTGQKEPVVTATVSNFLVTRADLPDDAVYTMTKAMFTHLDQMVAAHGAAKAIKLENALKGMPLTVHPGAERYYREAGILK